MAGFWVELAGPSGQLWFTAAVEAPQASTAAEYAAREGRTYCARADPTARAGIPTLASIRVWTASSAAVRRPGGTPVFTAALT